MRGPTVSIAAHVPRDVMVRYQEAQVRRTRALLAHRSAERHGEDPAAHRAMFDAAGAEVAALERDHRVPFAELVGALELDAAQRDALVICAAPHLDDGVRDAIARFWGEPARRHVDAALVLELVQPTAVEAIAAARQLREGSALNVAGLIELVPVPVGHTPSQLELELVPTPRLLRVLDGEVGLDPRLRAIARLAPVAADAARGVVSRERWLELAAMVRSAQGAGVGGGARLLIAGASGSGKLRLAQAIAAATGSRQLLVVESAFLPAEPARLIRLIEALAQEAAILGAQLVLRRIDSFVDRGATAQVVRHALAAAVVPVWCTSDVDPSRTDAPQLADLAALRISLALPDAGLRREAWHAELARVGVDADDAEIQVVGTEYPLSRTAVELAARLVEGALAAGAPREGLLARVAETQVRGQLARYARRSRSRARVDDVVLTDTTREQIHELVIAVQRRTGVLDRWGLTERHATGRGIVSLFNGPPGTGKTMTASAIANELGLPLYRIDVSSIVDRFVGETEKNLVRMFDEASASRAALLFDEADSLFAKRIAADDATGRYANMQVNLLLNLIEDYDGFVVLTTNFKGALDDAFLRRIVYKIVFEMPEHDELVALWDYHLPESIPRAANLDLDRLADEFDAISGGDIKNAVLRAALGAEPDQPLTMEMLRRSVIKELRANGAVVAERR